MENLNLNFGNDTKLHDWHPVVKSNLDKLKKAVDAEEKARADTDAQLDRNVSTGLATERNARIAADALKADKQNTDGGFAGGDGAQAAFGAAVGDHASAHSGGAVGSDAASNNGGAAGYNAKTLEGGAIGWGASSPNGGAVGYNAKADAGGAVGAGANAYWGGAVGMNAESSGGGGAVGGSAYCLEGGAVGDAARAGDGFAGGSSAKTVNNGNVIDAVQLGRGTNPNQFTMQLYDYQITDCADYADESAEKWLKDVGRLADLQTTVKSTVVGAINNLESGKADRMTDRGGFAGGHDAFAGFGGAIGQGAYAIYGGAVGFDAKTAGGFAGGQNAQTVDAQDQSIDAIQLGKGTNSTPKTMQVYGKRIVDSDGSLTDVGVLADLLTASKNTIVSALNELHQNQRRSYVMTQAEYEAADKDPDTIYYVIQPDTPPIMTLEEPQIYDPRPDYTIDWTAQAGGDALIDGDNYSGGGADD